MEKTIVQIIYIEKGYKFAHFAESLGTGRKLVCFEDEKGNDKNFPLNAPENSITVNIKEIKEEGLDDFKKYHLVFRVPDKENKPLALIAEEHDELVNEIKSLRENKVPTLREIEFAIRDSFVREGKALDGTWGFETKIISLYGCKKLSVSYYEKGKEEVKIYGKIEEDYDNLFKKTYKYFNELNEEKEQ